MGDLAVKKLNCSEMTQNVSHLSTEVAQQVAQLADVVGCLRAELNKDLPIQHVALILAVVKTPGISMQALMEHLGMPQGSVSRNVKLLSDKGRGYDLLRNEQDTVNRKQVLVFPTQKCVDLVGKLCGLMQTEIAVDVNRCRCHAVAN